LYFRRFQKDNMVHEEDLSELLQVTGFFLPNDDWITEAREQITKYVTMDDLEFIQFMLLYDKMNNDYLTQLYREHDVDGSGDLDYDEVLPLFQQQGFSTLRHVTRQLFDEMDTNGDGILSVEEFLESLDLVRARFGFPQKDVKHFLRTFKKFDSGTNQLNTNNLKGALNYLNYHLNEKTIHKLARSVDEDGSGSISQLEFLMFLALVRDHEITKIRELIKEHDENRNGLTSLKELAAICVSLGYSPEDTAITQALEDAKPAVEDELDLSDVCNFLDVYRSREGLTRDEAELISTAFAVVDASNVGFLTYFEISRALRQLGYVFPLEVVSRLCGQADIDNSNTLDEAEFLKLVRICRGEDVTRLQLSLREHLSVEQPEVADWEIDDIDWTSIVLGEKQTHAALVTVAGLEEMADRIMAKVGEAGLSCCDLLALVLEARKQDRVDFMRKSAGFSRNEVEELQTEFCKYAQSKDSVIVGNSVRTLFSDILYEHRVMKDEVLCLLRSLDKGASGYSFEDFLRLKRHIVMLADRGRLERETEAIRKQGFSRQEVGEFRALFNGDDPSAPRDSFSFRDLIETLTGTIPLTGKIGEELKAVYEASLPRNAVRDLDFPQFLQLMRKLLSMNFHGIEERTAEIVADVAVVQATSTTRRRSFAEFVADVSKQKPVNLDSEDFKIEYLERLCQPRSDEEPAEVLRKSRPGVRGSWGAFDFGQIPHKRASVLNRALYSDSTSGRRVSQLRPAGIAASTGLSRRTVA
jgi:Ca2+-binding EF-hand superfamily protein